jgi:hypothetical protein
MIASSCRRASSSLNTRAPRAARSSAPSGAEHLATKGGDHVGEPVGSRSYHLPSQQVGIHDDGPQLGQASAHLALARSDSSGEAHAQHRGSLPAVAVADDKLSPGSAGLRSRRCADRPPGRCREPG